ncbi:nuclear transport factor 2 family protein [Parablautia intestinalis]|nr:nuclear transport factor 2 family protein [Parablautia intestinalis]
MKDRIIEQSQKFWQSLEKADSKGMREVCDPGCWFVHIGMSCGLDEEMEAFDKKLFQPTQIDIHGQEVREWGEVSVCMTDVDYSLLLGGKETTHHFMTTEVYQNRNGEWKLIQFTFTALVN